jgi:hypothetical protein
MSKQTRTGKKPYKKPEVKKVQLKPEEAVLGACKSSGNVGPAALNCTTGSACSSLGS